MPRRIASRNVDELKSGIAANIVRHCYNNHRHVIDAEFRDGHLDFHLNMRGRIPNRLANAIFDYLKENYVFAFNVRLIVNESRAPQIFTLPGDRDLIAREKFMHDKQHYLDLLSANGFDDVDIIKEGGQVHVLINRALNAVEMRAATVLLVGFDFDQLIMRAPGEGIAEGAAVHDHVGGYLDALLAEKKGEEDEEGSGGRGEEDGIGEAAEEDDDDWMDGEEDLDETAEQAPIDESREEAVEETGETAEEGDEAIDAEEGVESRMHREGDVEELETFTADDLRGGLLSAFMEPEEIAAAMGVDLLTIDVHSLWN
ncbi:MAG: hypothetical protein RLN62_04290 [Rickettsiales bacterium]